MTEAFAKELPTLSRKPILTEYDAWTQQLLAFWRTDGELNNLLYLSLACSDDGGVHALAADIEIMLMELVRHTNRAFEAPSGKARRKTTAPLSRIKAAEAALRTKLTVLRAAPEIHQRLQTACRSVVGHRVLERARHYPPDCHLWRLVEWLADRLSAVVDLTFSIDPELPVLHAAAAEELANHVATIYQATMSTPPPPEDNEGVIGSLIAQVEHKYRQWLRALITKFDMRHYQITNDALAHTTRPHVVCFDISRSSKVLRQEVQKDDQTSNPTRQVAQPTRRIPMELVHPLQRLGRAATRRLRSHAL